MRIGVISDTHNFFDPQIPALLKGVEYILHAGDIGLPQIIVELEKIAPVYAVLGNTDDPGFGYSLNRVTALAGRKFLLQHIVNPHAPDESLQGRLDRERPDVVVFGHTHKPCFEKRGSIYFFNPGYAGKSRFGMPRTVAVLECTGQHIKPDFFPLQ
jgi:putative phosphoesterase